MLKSIMYGSRKVGIIQNCPKRSVIEYTNSAIFIGISHVSQVSVKQSKPLFERNLSLQRYNFDLTYLTCRSGIVRLQFL